MNKSNARYTYATFALDVIALMNGEKEFDKLTADEKSAIREKAYKLLETNQNKAEYNAKNPKKSAAKGASSETQERADLIATVLTLEPMTGAEINAKLGTAFEPLQISNAVRFIANLDSKKVIREFVSKKGLRSEKEYTGYFLTVLPEVEETDNVDDDSENVA